MTISHHQGCGCKEADEVLKGGEFLLKYIDIEKVTALNEKVILQHEGKYLCCIHGSCRKILKAYDDRLSSDNCESDVDNELVGHLHGRYPAITPPSRDGSRYTGDRPHLFLIGGEKGMYPKKMKIFSNREDIDFENINDFKCIQEVELSEDFHGSIEYPLKVTSLFNVSYLTLFFYENYGAETTKISYIGIPTRKGVNTPRGLPRTCMCNWEVDRFCSVAVTHLCSHHSTCAHGSVSLTSQVYEASPNLADHKIEGAANMTKFSFDAF
ncbi:thioredoxin, putative [Plasmodium ovale wallikeri]|uniref:Thioredoxin, putative n=1 Tax=Plasmodium ovale wallikeri TaxID=864142 RepID=A0A1A8ZB08_PLAOA|nr:thioredoxin, putative [Plasmodium ovale wallikeri]